VNALAKWTRVFDGLGLVSVIIMLLGLYRAFSGEINDRQFYVYVSICASLIAVGTIGSFFSRKAEMLKDSEKVWVSRSSPVWIPMLIGAVLLMLSAKYFPLRITNVIGGVVLTGAVAFFCFAAYRLLSGSRRTAEGSRRWERPLRVFGLVLAIVILVRSIWQLLR
jgi:NADH:ubiquinone oxidoreductase subunit 6 (subunit J)